MTKIIALLVIIALAAFYFYRTSTNKVSVEENLQAGAEFLAANREKEGVQVTETGLQYRVLEEGEGSESPEAHDRVTVHYEGRLIDGTVFDSSFKRGKPIDFALNQVIRGWEEGLQMMVVGETRRLFVPAELAYGNQGAGPIPPGATLIFDVELLGINQ